MNQKEEEIIVMEYFKSKYPGFPEGKLIKSESPDFILKLRSRKKVGIELTRLKENNNHNHNHGYVVPEITRENVETTILGKEEKIKIYQGRKVVKLWLIITVDYLKPDDSASALELVLKSNYPSSFAKIFLFDLMEGTIYRLNSKPVQKDTENSEKQF